MLRGARAPARMQLGEPKRLSGRELAAVSLGACVLAVVPRDGVVLYRLGG